MNNLGEEKINGGVAPPRGGLATWLILLFFLAGAVLVALDWDKFAPVLTQAEGTPLLGALALTLISYICVSSTFALVSRLMGIRMSFRDLAETGFVTITMNHVLSTGGVAGYSIRYILMRKHGAALKDVLATSVLHFYLTSLDMLIMLPVAFLYLFLNASLPAGVTAMVGMMTLLMSIIAAAATVVIFMGEWRGKLARALTRLGRALLHRDLGDRLGSLDSTLGRGVEAMRSQPSTVMLTIALTWIDWFASLGVLWMCFDALGEPLRLGVTLSGYVIGVMAGVLSMIPGGLGVQEGSMAGVFVLLGAPFQQAILATVLFRGIYYLLPYGMSFGFYRRLLR